MTDGKVRKEVGKPVIFTANRLRDGKVVWLDAEGGWSETVDAALIYEGAAIEAGRALALDWERRQEVVGSYHVEVSAGAGAPAPVSVREKIRAQGGPTTLYGTAEVESVRAHHAAQ